MSLDTATARGRRRHIEQFRATCVRRRFVSTVDEYGNQVRDPANPIDVEFPCRLVPSGQGGQAAGREITIDRETQISDWDLLLPWDADVQASDQILLDGVTFEVLGLPAPGRVVKIARLRHVV